MEAIRALWPSYYDALIANDMGMQPTATSLNAKGKII